MKHGTGYYKNKVTNEIYIGEFVSGAKEGKGRLVCSDGSVYVGQLIDDLPHGTG